MRVLIIGAARQGLALARFLATRGARVTLTDQRSASELQQAQQALANLPLEWALGGHSLDLLDGIDLLCPSGGVPLTIPIVVEARRRGIPLSNDSQIFLEEAPCTVIGITGSAGKTTTTVLVGRMAATDYGPERTWVGGNIGNPLITKLDHMAEDHLAVVELSSFQLEIMTQSPPVAAILNITPNHLDRHKTMEAYTAAKARILRFQQEKDVAILGHDDPGAWGLVDAVRGRLLSFGWGQPVENRAGIFLHEGMVSFWDGESIQDLVPQDLIRLRGEHNVLNVLAACAIAKAAGLSVQAMRSGVADFTGVEHRLEFVRSRGGVRWFNDSIATAPERAMAAIRSFDQPLILLAGGRDKNLPWDEFALMVCQRVDHLVLFGEAGAMIEQIVQRLRTGPRPFSIHRCAGLEEAVKTADQVAEPGDVVLLAPGGTSFDEFQDYAERGERFREWVRKLPA